VGASGDGIAASLVGETVGAVSIGAGDVADVVGCGSGVDELSQELNSQARTRSAITGYDFFTR
jgi:hypothetical protein